MRTAKLQSPPGNPNLHCPQAASTVNNSLFLSGSILTSLFCANATNVERLNKAATNNVFVIY
jgi:hypothetical protein